MVMRLKTRLSAGAALVTGLGMMGIATALPAQAATTLTYTCSVSYNGVELGAGAATVTLDTNAPQSVAPGDTLTIDSVTADVTIPIEGASDAVDMGDFGLTIPVEAPVRVGDQIIASVDTTLTSTDVRAGEDEVQASLANTDSRSVLVPAEAAGMTFEVLAPTSLRGTLSLPYEGETAEATVHCTTDSSDRVVDAVTVTAPTTDEGRPVDQGGGDVTDEDTTTDEDPGDDTATTGGDTTDGQPEVPEVVQTDGLTPAVLPQDDNTAALALGGLLLAGAGAGTVLVARRRAAQH